MKSLAKSAIGRESKVRMSNCQAWADAMLNDSSYRLLVIAEPRAGRQSPYGVMSTIDDERVKTE